MKYITQSFTYTALLAWLALSLVSCSDDDDNSLEEVLQGQTILTVPKEEDGTLLNLIGEGLSLGVYGTDASGNLLVNDLALSTDNVETRASGGNEVKYLYFYAPYNSYWTDGPYTDYHFTVSTDQTTTAGLAASDLLYIVPTANPVSVDYKDINVIPLSVTHCMSRINFQLTTNLSDLSLAKATIVIVNTYPEVYYKPATGEITLCGLPQRIEGALIEDENADIKGTVVLPPQYMSQDLYLFEVKLSDGTLLHATAPANINFNGNSQYDFVLKIKQDEELAAEDSTHLSIEVTLVSTEEWDGINPWLDDDDNTGGTLRR